MIRGTIQLVRIVFLIRNWWRTGWQALFSTNRIWIIPKIDLIRRNNAEKQQQQQQQHQSHWPTIWERKSMSWYIEWHKHKRPMILLILIILIYYSQYQWDLYRAHRQREWPKQTEKKSCVELLPIVCMNVRVYSHLFNIIMNGFLWFDVVTAAMVAVNWDDSNEVSTRSITDYRMHHVTLHVFFYHAACLMCAHAAWKKIIAKKLITFAAACGLAASNSLGRKSYTGRMQPFWISVAAIETKSFYALRSNAFQ